MCTIISEKIDYLLIFFYKKKKKNQVWNIANENETIINARKLAAVNNGFDFIGWNRVL